MIQFTEDDARLFVVGSSSYDLRCAFESQQRVVCDRVAGKRKGRVVFRGHYLTLVDISSMVYVIFNMSSHLKHLLIANCHECRQT